MGDDTLDMSAVSMTLAKEDIVNAIIPEVIKQLATNQTLQTAIVNAIMPAMRAQMATIARSTAGAGTTTPRNAS